MSNRSRRTAGERAEARRRARLSAQGRDEELDQDEEPAPTNRGAPQPGGSFLGRLFPPAPPLPNRPDPLRGFSYEGPLRGVVAGLYLLVRNPIPWIAFGVLWAMGRVVTGNTLVGLVGSLVSFGALIAAGWFGWQRPWLFGVAAALVGWAVFLALVFTYSAGEVGTPAASGASPTPTAVVSPGPSVAGASPVASPTPTTGGDAEAGLVQAILVQTALQIALGAAAGWYGGYLRRRMAVTSAAARGQGNRRR